MSIILLFSQSQKFPRFGFSRLPNLSPMDFMQPTYVYFFIVMYKAKGKTAIFWGIF